MQFLLIFFGRQAEITAISRVCCNFERFFLYTMANLTSKSFIVLKKTACQET